MDNSGEILVKQVIDDKTILLEANNRIIPYSISSIINGQIIKLVNKTGKQSKNGHYKSTYSVGDIVKYKSQQYLILSVSYQTVMNTNEQLLKYGHIQYYVKCLTCGATFYKPAYLVEKTGCPVCSNMEVFPGINDIPTTDPWMIDYFQGGLEEAKNYHSGTTKKIYPKCPLCGRIHDKEISIVNLRNQGFQCVCSDGIKYPEKFMINFLEQCGVNFIFQPTNLHLPFDAKKKRYDFYLTDYRIIIETHGGQHYDDSYIFGTAKKQQEENDYEKYCLAKDYVSEYIVIDCRESNKDWIKKSICNSELSNILNFNETEIDWDECSKFAMSNMAKLVCDYYNEHDVTIKGLSDIFHVGDHGIKTYLKCGAENGWCKYVATRSFFSMIPFEIYRDNQFVCYGKSAKSFSRESEKILGINLDYNGIRKCLIGEMESYKNYTFKKITDFKLKREVLCRDDCF